MMIHHPSARLPLLRSRAVLRLAAAVLASLLWSTAYAAQFAVSFSTRTSGDIPLHTGETEFTCSDTIYALIDADGLADGIHEVEIHWLNPVGDRQELTRFSAAASGDSTLLWGWLRLHAPENSAIARAFDPSHGMRNFIGRWSVKVYVDGRHVATGHFEVLC